MPSFLNFHRKCVHASKLRQSLPFSVNALTALSGHVNNLLMCELQMQPCYLLALRPLPEFFLFPINLCILLWKWIHSSVHALRVPVLLKTVQKRHWIWCTLQYTTLLRINEGGVNWGKGRRIDESPSNSTEPQEVANETESDSSCAVLHAVSSRHFTALSRG